MFERDVDRFGPVSGGQHGEATAPEVHGVEIARVGGVVGDDEADVSAGKISWASPLGRAMIGAKIGDTVVWRRPAGEAQVCIVDIRYP